MMGKGKKINPRRKPATQADVNKAKKAATDEAVTLAWSILFTVLRDKEGMGIDDLKRIWKEVDDLSDSVVQGYVSVADLRNVLKEELGVELT